MPGIRPHQANRSSTGSPVAAAPPDAEDDDAESEEEPQPVRVSAMAVDTATKAAIRPRR